jgi:hypothetical protein
MRIYLDGNSSYFILPGKEGYHEFDDLNLDDTVRIYTMDKTWGIFGFGSRLVYHMVRLNDNRIFVDLLKNKINIPDYGYCPQPLHLYLVFGT